MALSYLQKVLVRGEFTAGSVDPVGGEPNMFTAGIDVSGGDPMTTSGIWWSQIEVHGGTERDALMMREFVLVCIREKLQRMSMQELKDLRDA